MEVCTSHEHVEMRFTGLIFVEFPGEEVEKVAVEAGREGDASASHLRRAAALVQRNRGTDEAGEQECCNVSHTEIAWRLEIRTQPGKPAAGRGPARNIPKLNRTVFKGKRLNSVVVETPLFLLLLNPFHTVTPRQARVHESAVRNLSSRPKPKMSIVSKCPSALPLLLYL